MSTPNAATAPDKTVSMSPVQLLAKQLTDAIVTGNKELEKTIRKELKALVKPAYEFKPWTEAGEFKGNPMLILHFNEAKERFNPFQFGKNKAKLIVACIDDIRRFAEAPEAVKK